MDPQTGNDWVCCSRMMTALTYLGIENMTWGPFTQTQRPLRLHKNRLGFHKMGRIKKMKVWHFHRALSNDPPLLPCTAWEDSQHTHAHKHIHSHTQAHIHTHAYTYGANWSILKTPECGIQTLLLLFLSWVDDGRDLQKRALMALMRFNPITTLFLWTTGFNTSYNPVPVNHWL